MDEENEGSKCTLCNKSLGDNDMVPLKGKGAQGVSRISEQVGKDVKVSTGQIIDTEC